MHANVPQFIEMEDKIAFGLTSKQLLWMGGMAACLIVLYGLVDRQIFLFVAIFIVIIFGTFTFYRPQGIPFISFFGFMVQYFTSPKKYIWRRVYDTKESAFSKSLQEAQKKRTGSATQIKRIPSQSQLKRIAWVLDTKK
ncbi:MAG: PrgI family protein [Candidatus Moranbacteria bacterium]|nr:PrgI family protein [Candidatus Moranbacteria bacterium]